MNSSFKLFFLFAFNTCIRSAQIFMAKNGNDSPGNDSFDKPNKPLMKSQEKANFGDVVIFRGGAYKDFSISDIHIIISINSQKNGFSYQTYNQGKVVFDFKLKDAYRKRNGKNIKRVSAFLVWKNTQDIRFKDFDCTRVHFLTYDELVAMKYF